MSATTSNERVPLLPSTPPTLRPVAHPYQQFSQHPASPSRILPSEYWPAPVEAPGTAPRVHTIEDHATNVVLKYLGKVLGTIATTSAALFGLSFFEPQNGKLGRIPEVARGCLGISAFLAVTSLILTQILLAYKELRYIAAPSRSRYPQLLFRIIFYTTLAKAFASYICLGLGLTMWLGGEHRTEGSIAVTIIIGVLSGLSFLLCGAVVMGF